MLEIVREQGREKLLYQGQVIHQSTEALQEARIGVAKLADAPRSLILIFGLGLGRHIQALRERWPSVRLAVFEQSDHLIEAYLELQKQADSGVDEAPVFLKTEADLEDFLVREVVKGPHPDPGMFILPGYERLFPSEAESFKAAVRWAGVRRAVNDKTLREKGWPAIENLARNIEPIISLPVITDIKDRIPTVPGFIVGSGPSLERNLGELQKAASRGMIIAASSALKPLQARGITPHMVVVVETEDTSPFLTSPPTDAPVLLALASSAHPNHFGLSGFVSGVFHLSPGASFLFDAKDFVPQAGTSGSAAFTLGLLLGLDPLILVGQDQAFSRNKVHAGGTPGDVDLTLDMTHYSVPAVGGGAVATHSGFIASLHWFAESIRYINRTQPGRKVYNAGDSGAHIPGVPETALWELMGTLPVQNRLPDPAGLLKGLPRPDPASVRQELQSIWDYISRLTALFRLSPEKADSLFEESRKTHPLLRFAFAGLPPGHSDLELGDALTRVENLVLEMLHRLEE